MNLEELYNFIKECYPFFVCTINKKFPAARPFGAIMLCDNCFYVATGKNKDCYLQLINDAPVQIVANKAGTREWVRINGLANEELSIELKRKMFETNPILQRRYSGINDPNLALIKITVTNY